MTITLFRTVILYIMVALGLRIMGKRQIGDMQPSELVVTIMISELAALPIQDLNRPMVNGIIAIITLVVLELILSFILLKSNSFRKIFSGNPAFIIKNGKIDQKVLKKLRISIEDVMEDLRQQAIFNIEDVDYAIIETNGKLSVLKKPEKQETTLADMNIAKANTGIPSMLISDGKLVPEGLPLTGFTKSAIHEILKKRKMEMGEVFVMIGDNAGNYTLIAKENNMK